MATGASSSNRWTASIRSARRTSAASPTRFSSTPTAPSASSKTPAAEALPAETNHPPAAPIRGVRNEAAGNRNRNVRNENENDAGSSSHPARRDRNSNHSSPRRSSGYELAASSHSAPARLQTAAAQAHRTRERHGHLPAGRSRIASHRRHRPHPRRFGQRTRQQSRTHGSLR